MADPLRVYADEVPRVLQSSNNSYKRQRRTRFRVARNVEDDNVGLIIGMFFEPFQPILEECHPQTHLDERSLGVKSLSCGTVDLALRSLGKIQRVGH